MKITGFVVACLLLCACSRAPRADRAPAGPARDRQPGATVKPAAPATNTTAHAPVPAAATNSGEATIALDYVRERLALFNALTSNSYSNTLHPELAQIIVFRTSIDQWQSADWARISACINEFSPADQAVLLDLLGPVLCNLEYKEYPGIAQVARQFCGLADQIVDRVFAERLINCAASALESIEQPEQAQALFAAAMVRMDKNLALYPSDLYDWTAKQNGKILGELGRCAESIAVLEQRLARSTTPSDRAEVRFTMARSYTMGKPQDKADIAKGLAILHEQISDPGLSEVDKQVAVWWLDYCQKHNIGN